MNGRVAALVIVLAVVLVSVACSDASEPRASAPPVTERAGVVIEARGAVSVHGDSGVQPLAVGDVVRGVDVIETGVDGYITIRLDHNRARWSLTPGKKRQVSESSAWSAPVASDEPLMAGKVEPAPTAAAGRHSERQVSDTLATAQAGAEPSRESVAAAPAPVPLAETGDRVSDSRAGLRREAAGGKPETTASKTSARGAGKASSELDDLLSVDSFGGGQPARAARAPAAPVESAPSMGAGGEATDGVVRVALGGTEVAADAGALARALRAAFQPRLAAIERCVPAMSAGARHSVLVRVTVEPGGEVAVIEIAAASDAVTACVRSALDRLSVPAGTVDATVRGAQRVILSAP